ncbi:MAG: hypothetical protein QGI33_07680 [Candidatus Brocadiia bacterium]|nr:hypothetical protein [Candidatus Brocadiia bacterium]
MSDTTRAPGTERDPACEEARENLKKLCQLTGSMEQGDGMLAVGTEAGRP